MGSIPLLTVSFSYLEGFQYLQNSSDVAVCNGGEPGPLRAAALVLDILFPLVSHPLPSLFNSCLNLRLETQRWLGVK